MFFYKKKTIEFIFYDFFNILFSFKVFIEIILPGQFGIKLLFFIRFFKVNNMQKLKKYKF